MSRPKSIKSAEQTAEGAKPGTPADPKYLQALQANEAIISKAQSSFLDLGMALLAIREQKQFEAAGFESFEAYCVKKWGYTQNYANRLIAAYSCHELLKAELASSGEVLPGNEYQYRSLAGLPKAQWVKTWKQVLSSAAGKPVTGEMVEMAVKKLEEPDAETHKATKGTKSSTAKTGKPAEAKQLAKIGAIVRKALKNKASLSTEKAIELLEKIQKLVAKAKAS